MRSIVLIVIFTAIAAVAAGLNQQQPVDKPDKPVDQADFVISDLRVQEFPARNYLYISQQTTIPQIGEVVGPAMERLMETVRENDIQIIAAPIFVYKGATGEMDKPFELQIGFPVSDTAKADGDVKTRQLEKYRCATVLYSGPMDQVGQAYGKIFPELMQAGLEPSGDSREMHLYFESIESPNNIVLIQVGVK